MALIGTYHMKREHVTIYALTICGMPAWISLAHQGFTGHWSAFAKLAFILIGGTVMGLALVALPELRARRQDDRWAAEIRAHGIKRRP